MNLTINNKILLGILIILTTSQSFAEDAVKQQNVPKAFWVSQPIQPDETVMVSGGNFDASATIDVAFIPNTPIEYPGCPSLPSLNWQNIDALQSSNRSVKFIIPATFPKGLYAYQITSNGQTSDTYYINKADVWFWQGNQGRTATPGGSITVHGTALAFPENDSNIKPFIALVDSNNSVVLASADSTWSQNPKTAGYSQSFTLPDNLPLGDYTLYYSNGYGGSASWSEIYNYRTPKTRSISTGNPHYPVPSNKITIETPISWPNLTVDMPAPVTTGTDDNNFQAALKKLHANNGGILTIPAGTYQLNQPLYIPANVVLKGAGQDSTTLNWIVEPEYPQGSPHSLISGVPSTLPVAWGFAKFSVEGLTITTTQPHKGKVITLSQNHTGDPVFIRDVTINTPGGSDASSMTYGIHIYRTENVDISNTTITASTGVEMVHSAYVNIHDSHFTYTHSSVAIDSTNNIDVANNHFTVEKGYIFDGHEYGFEVHGTYIAYDIYFGGNYLDRIGPPDQTLGSMTLDGPPGSAFFGKGVVANGTTLTFPNELHGYFATTVAMILSGTGAGQWRWIMGGTITTPRQKLTIDRAWDIPPDTDSVITVVGLIGRTIFAGNSYLQQAGWNVAYFSTMDFIQANNTMTTADVPGVWAGQRGRTVVPQWHCQTINNRITAISAPNHPYFYGSLSDALASENSWYTDPVLSYHVYRNNIFDDGVPGWNRFIATSTASDIIVERNHIPLLSFQSKQEPTDITFLSSMLRQNTSNLGGALTIQMNPSSLENTIQTFQ